MYLQITEEVEPGPYLLKGVYSETVKLWQLYLLANPGPRGRIDFRALFGQVTKL